jgi:hypothetical protein
MTHVKFFVSKVRVCKVNVKKMARKPEGKDRQRHIWTDGSAIFLPDLTQVKLPEDRGRYGKWSRRTTT